MFTGLIQKKGKLSQIVKTAGQRKLTITFLPWEEPLQLGESVAVNGVCLTVTDAGKDRFTADVLDETFDVTALGKKKVGDVLNLERALKASDRLGGHIVNGHVDGIGRIKAVTRRGRDYVLRIQCAKNLCAEMVKRGSVAVDGISLTISELGGDWVEVNIIPTTWNETNLATLQTGHTVNLETDILAKYVRKIIAKPDGDISMQSLADAGFF